jgi:hypothetical protein
MTFPVTQTPVGDRNRNEAPAAGAPTGVLAAFTAKFVLTCSSWPASRLLDLQEVSGNDLAAPASHPHLE